MPRPGVRAAKRRHWSDAPDAASTWLGGRSTSPDFSLPGLANVSTKPSRNHNGAFSPACLFYQHMQKLMQQQSFVAPVVSPYCGGLQEYVAAASRGQHPARLSGRLPEQLGAGQLLHRRAWGICGATQQGLRLGPGGIAFSASSPVSRSVVSKVHPAPATFCHPWSAGVMPATVPGK